MVGPSCAVYKLYVEAQLPHWSHKLRVMPNKQPMLTQISEGWGHVPIRALAWGVHMQISSVDRSSDARKTALP